MSFTEDMIEEKLKSYNELQKKIMLLEYEITHPVKLSSSELLDALSFGKSQSGVSTKNCGTDCDRVSYLATHYRRIAEKMSEEANGAIFQEWCELMEDAMRLEHYISLLPEIYQLILRAVYIDQKHWGDIEQETGVSRRTLLRKKENALNSLVEMYSYSERFIIRTK